KKFIEILTSDLSGEQSEDVQTVKLSLDAGSYEIDLTPQEREELGSALRVYVAKARRAASAKKAGGKSVASAYSAQELKAAREWLRLRGHEVSDRGRIKKDLLDEWQSHGKPGA
ncbi:MAG: Lsr2 dimerization domain-containing protein, partial [Brevibacterium yomogidense]